MKVCIILKVIFNLNLLKVSTRSRSTISIFLPFEVSDEFVSTEREELDFLIVETAEETKDEEVMEDTELSFFDSKEFFFTAETDFDLEVLLLELSDSAVVSSVDSTENKVSCNTLSNR